jgi:pyruvate,water dikinase
VLVAETAVSTWTALFATVAAVVTNTGGALSNSAVIAREYGIPAVVGARRATEILRDGQLVEVDGDSGVVRAAKS